MLFLQSGIGQHQKWERVRALAVRHEPKGPFLHCHPRRQPKRKRISTISGYDLKKAHKKKQSLSMEET